MNAPVQVPVFAKFIDDLRAIWAADGDNKARMEKAKPFLEQLVRDNGLKALSAKWPSTEGGKNLLLYVDPDAEDLHTHLDTVETPLNTLEAADLCPGTSALEKINASLR